MGTEKRERQKQGRQARIEEARAAQQRAQRLRTARNFGLVVVVILVALFALSRLTGKSDDPSTVTASGGPTSSAPGATSPTGSSTTVAPGMPSLPAPGATITGDTPCPPSDGSAARTTTFAQAPPTCIGEGKTYTAKVETSKGSFTIALDAAKAPKTVNNFVVLARYHYYDGVAFHRVIPGFVVQGGDAVGPTPGQGGPGYSLPDELPTAGPPYYPLQSLAMANAGPDTGGSQFFVVTGQQGVDLPANYSLFGAVTDGYDVVTQIEALGSAGGDPTTVVTITSVTITET
ncbi:MAG: peptidylprolyl isomerase [Acidimicrobiales bacterium]